MSSSDFGMKPKQDERIHTNCIGCLSDDRYLQEVAVKYLELYHNLLGKTNVSCNGVTLRMCWECRALLHRVQQFQIQIHKAYACLQQSIERTTSLSGLTITKQEITIHCQENNYIEKPTITNNNKTTIKEETEINQEQFFDYDDYNIDVKQETSKRKNNKQEKKAKFNKTIHRNINIRKYFTKIAVTDGEFENIKDSDEKCNNKLSKSKKLDTKVNSEERIIIESGEKCINKLSKKVNSGEDNVDKKRNVYKCNLCSYGCSKKSLQRLHVRRYHSLSYPCDVCDHIFINGAEYKAHYKELHSRMICDYCGKRFRSSRSIAAHIKRNHTALECRVCERSYSTYHSLENHQRRRHPHLLPLPHPRYNTEDCYCVECDKQYTTLYNYKNHLRTSVRHTLPKKVSVPCPECGKVFTRKTYMNNHYRLSHINNSKHYCQLCDKYYLTAFSLRMHKQLVHDKIPHPRNKVCKICGKAFSTNRTLQYHVRTHTGEKPHHCQYCPASFSWKKSLMSHVLALHKKMEITTTAVSCETTS